MPCPLVSSFERARTGEAEGVDAETETATVIIAVSMKAEADHQQLQQQQPATIFISPATLSPAATTAASTVLPRSIAALPEAAPAITLALREGGWSPPTWAFHPHCTAILPVQPSSISLPEMQASSWNQQANH